MDDERTPFDELLEKWHAGDPEATVALFSRYDKVIREAVRRRLPERMRREFDSLDFAQDVWASFCAMAPERNEFRTRQALQAFLTQVAYNKVTDTYRRRMESKGHTTRREVEWIPQPSPDGTPSQFAIAGERWALIAAKLPPAYTAVIERLREGYTQAEVAAMAGISSRTVSRILERVHRMCEEEA